MVKIVYCIKFNNTYLHNRGVDNNDWISSDIDSPWDIAFFASELAARSFMDYSIKNSSDYIGYQIIPSMIIVPEI